MLALRKPATSPHSSAPLNPRNSSINCSLVAICALLERKGVLKHLHSLSASKQKGENSPQFVRKKSFFAQFKNLGASSAFLRKKT